MLALLVTLVFIVRWGPGSWCTAECCLSRGPREDEGWRESAGVEGQEVSMASSEFCPARLEVLVQQSKPTTTQRGVHAARELLQLLPEQLTTLPGADCGSSAG